MWAKKITPRFGDVDGLRHINNCMIPVWFELGREPVFRLFHPELDLGRWNLIMAKITVEYVAQMRLGFDVEIRTFIRKTGRSSVTVYQEAWQGGELGAKGEAIIVHYDFDNLKSLAIPETIREQLAKHMIEENHPNLRTRSGRFPGAAR